jgi:hypothetical protein
MFHVLKITNMCMVKTFQDMLFPFWYWKSTEKYICKMMCFQLDLWCQSSSVSLLSFHCGYNFSVKFILLIMFEVEVTVLLQKSGNRLPSDTCHIQKDLKLCLHCCENIIYHSMSCPCAQHVSNWKCESYMEKSMCVINIFWERIRKTWNHYFYGILVACQCSGGTYCLKMRQDLLPKHW